MSGPVNLLDAYPFGGAGVSVKVGGQKKLGTGGQDMTPPVEVKVAGQMEGARRRRRHTKKGGQEGARRRKHTKKGGQEGARRRKHTKKGGQEGARRHRSRKH
jgi:hypothetical protein